MRFLQVIVLISFTAITSAQLTYNVTQAYAPGNMEKYHCLNTAHLQRRLPLCLRECHIKANNLDECAFDDYVCRCVNYQNYSNLIEPCVFPPEFDGESDCSSKQLERARAVIQDMCNFFNATLYHNYQHCPQQLSESITYGIIMKEEIIVSY